MSQTDCPPSTSNVAPSQELVRCPDCSQPRFFKGQRGLKIHHGKQHRQPSSTQPPPPPAHVPTDHNHSRPAGGGLWKQLAELKSTCPVVARIPRGARNTVAASLSKCIRQTIETNDVSSWEQFFTFSYRTLHVTRDGKSSGSLTQKIKNNCTHPTETDNQHPPSNRLPHRNTAQLVERKINAGDIKGAAQLLFSSDAAAPDTAETLSALESKHPLSSPSSQLPPPPDPTERTPTATVEDVQAAVASFRGGSAGGLDGLSPQHYKDLIFGTTGDTGRVVLESVTQLVNLMLSGKVCTEITDVLYGANLCALKKKDGGIRPIAVGNAIRRVVSKICCKHIAPILSDKFQPTQLGFGSKGGCEAAVHAARAFLTSGAGEVLLKVDVRNAFNSVEREALLTQIKEVVPEIYHYMWQCYGEKTKLVYRNHLLYSAAGCQQGDPLGPAIFSLAIHPVITKIKSKFNVWYLDDGSIGDEASTALQDLDSMIKEFQNIGLELNFSKCELFINPNLPTDKQTDIHSKFNSLAPGIKILNKSSLRLLGSPVLDESIPKYIDDEITKFQESSHRLVQINPQIALVIIRYCLFVPKFTYVLRCSPIWRHQNLLNNLDAMIRNILTEILNCQLDNRSWAQASLPIRFGGLGIRSASSVALPAFLSSAHSTAGLYGKIIYPSLGDAEVTYLAEARSAWSDIAGPQQDVPRLPESQRLWDEPICRQVQENLLETATSPADRARLMASAEPESGHWLRALPSASVGTLLDRNTFNLSVCLRLGCKTNEPHRCRCGDPVDQLGHHGLSCQRSAGRLPRHAALNDVIRRAFASAGIPAILEPTGLARDDGKRPDGMTVMPWKYGKCLVWDATCTDTVAPSHIQGSAAAAGTAAAAAENLKRRKYNGLSDSYIFVPFGVETLGPWGPEARRLVKELSSRLVEVSRDQRAGSYLSQRISLAIQRGNAASLLGTIPGDGSELKEIFYL